MKFSEWQKTADSREVENVMRALQNPPAERTKQTVRERRGQVMRSMTWKDSYGSGKWLAFRRLLDAGIDPEILLFDWQHASIKQEVLAQVPEWRTKLKPQFAPRHSDIAEEIMVQWTKLNCHKQVIPVRLSMWAFEDLSDAVFFKLRFA